MLYEVITRAAEEGDLGAARRGEARRIRRARHELGAQDADGRITALSFDQFDDVGGYLRAPEPATFYRMHSYNFV